MGGWWTRARLSNWPPSRAITRRCCWKPPTKVTLALVAARVDRYRRWFMHRRRRLSGFPGIVWLVLIPCGLAAAVSDLDFQQPPHDYWTRPLHDPVTQLKTDLESGRLALDRSTERAFLVSLLQALRIPASSQILVFSTTSLQLRLISPSNPRALYFNDEVYVGFIPGGRVEVVSLDPE